MVMDPRILFKLTDDYGYMTGAGLEHS